MHLERAAIKPSRCWATLVFSALMVYQAEAMQGPALSADTGVPRARRAKHVPAKSVDAGAVSAKVILQDGKLQVEANNSDLSQIMNNVAEASGMTIDGAIGPARIFGVYGPKNPREVLAELLRGAGYNFIMMGTTADGAPRQLVLTQASTQPLPEIHSTPVASSKDSRNAETVQPAAEQPQAVPPAEGPPGESQDPQERMQKRLQRLQDMRDPPKASPPQ